MNCGMCRQLGHTCGKCLAGIPVAGHRTADIQPSLHDLGDARDVGGPTLQEIAAKADREADRRAGADPIYGGGMTGLELAVKVAADTWIEGRVGELPPKVNNSLIRGLKGLATDPAERKASPMAAGLLDYFPLALAEVARISKLGNDQHNPGQPLHWARGKSTDHADCIVRHLIERGALDTDGARHTAKLAWRALALLQEELEQN